MNYTPTTEEVREAYPFSKCLPPFYDPDHKKELEAAEAEFDRWLAGEIRKAKAEAWDEALKTSHPQGEWCDLTRTTCFTTHNPYAEGHSI